MFIPYLVFGFWSLLAMKLQKYEILCNLCLHFARQDGQDRKKRKENHATKVTKIPKTKRQKYGMNETLLNNFSLEPTHKFYIWPHLKIGQNICEIFWQTCYLGETATSFCDRIKFVKINIIKL
jgi:hypothetical protein